MNANNARIANELIDTFYSLKGYKIHILQYFDIRYQTLKIIQFLIISPNTTILNIIHYIQNNFIHTNNDTNWYHELLSMLDKMYEDPLQQKLCINQCKNPSAKKETTCPIKEMIVLPYVMEEVIQQQKHVLIQQFMQNIQINYQ